MTTGHPEPVSEGSRLAGRIWADPRPDGRAWGLTLRLGLRLAADGDARACHLTFRRDLEVYEAVCRRVNDPNDLSEQELRQLLDEASGAERTEE